MADLAISAGMTIFVWTVSLEMTGKDKTTRDETATLAFSPYDLARHIITNTDRNLFISGRPGTGKTTFLRELADNCPGKKMIVLAPTRESAVRAEGVSVHALFHFDDALYAAGEAVTGESDLPLPARHVLREIDTLVIDDVSLLRADTLDRINVALKSIRGGRRLFGGVQIVLAGDLYRMPPVVHESDRERFDELYRSPYFYSARCAAGLDLLYVEFDHVFEPDERDFAELLERARTAKLSGEDIASLGRLGRTGDPRRIPSHSVYLLPDSAAADRFNRSRIEKLMAARYLFEGEIERDFYIPDLPVPRQLVLKKGTRVIFVRDLPHTGVTKGMVGSVEGTDADGVRVFVPAIGTRVDVRPASWENTGFQYNKLTQAVSLRTRGRYRQLPLLPAWAVPVRGTEGMRFDRTYVDLRKCFEEGLAAAALDRCRSLAGIALTEKLSLRDVRLDCKVRHFLERMSGQQPPEAVAEAVGVRFDRRKSVRLPDVCYAPVRDEDRAAAVRRSLFQLREQIAAREGIAAEELLTRAQVRNIARRDPADLEELYRATDVTRAFVARYGKEILAAIA